MRRAERRARKEVEPQVSQQSLLCRSLHIAALVNLGVAQPLYAVLGANAEFFAVRRSHPVDLVLLTLLLSFGLPALVVAVESAVDRVSGRAGPMLHLALVAATIGLCTLPAFARALETARGAVAGALLAGAAGAWAYARLDAARWVATLLAAAVLVVPALFLLHSPVRKLLFPYGHPARMAVLASHRPVPVVLVVFDELPVVSLFDAAYRIDQAVYPNFFRLAQDSTWYRLASTVHQSTTKALSAILTGSHPVPGRMPTFRDYPLNLFTMLEGSYELHAFESVTTMLPDAERSPARLADRMTLLAADSAAIYLHAVLPAPLAASLAPPVNGRWIDYWSLDVNRSVTVAGRDSARTRYDRFRSSLRGNRPQQFGLFLDDIGADSHRALYFVHILLPHVPYQYGPDGRARPVPRDWRDREGVRGDWPADDPEKAAASYRRHLSQVRYVDVVLGQLLDRLRETGIYDDCLLIVTADHGVSFRPGSDRREPDPDNYLDILHVPLFVKAPAQSGGRIVDDPVLTIDIVPTIADVLGLDLPWPLDGRSLLESRKSVAPQPVVIRSRGKTFAFDRPTLVSAFSASLERRQVMASLHGGPGASDDSD